MLSDEEKLEMLLDAASLSRRDDFRRLRENNKTNISFDEYINFLDDLQKIFPSVKNEKFTMTKFNIL